MEAFLGLTVVAVLIDTDEDNIRYELFGPFPADQAQWEAALLVAALEQGLADGLTLRTQIWPLNPTGNPAALFADELKAVA